MVPMIATLTELRQVRKYLDQAIADVKARGLSCPDEIPLGIMVEVPAAAVLVDLFAQEASFMSLGTNDLVQYTSASARVGTRRPDSGAGRAGHTQRKHLCFAPR
jgi:phosphotransferase system enzyme I (PtsI)